MSADGWQYVIHDRLSEMIVGSLRVGDWLRQTGEAIGPCD